MSYLGGLLALQSIGGSFHKPPVGNGNIHDPRPNQQYTDSGKPLSKRAKRRTKAKLACTK